MKDYTVYLVFEPYGDWHQAEIVHISCEETADEYEIIGIASDELGRTKPELNEWAIKAYLVLDGTITPKYMGV